ncbi:PfkB family carbohydrate kinase [Magnetococcales bacterium HHB-1]
MTKICDLEQLAEVSRQLRAQQKRIVLCHGTFDLLHPGHIRHLQRASQEGDVLIVTVTADQFVNKGPNRPVFTDALRIESLASLAVVDYVAIVYEPTAISAIQAVCPNVYVKGKDYQVAEEDLTGNILKEKNAVETCGGMIFYTDEIVFSSTKLLNEHFDLFSPITKNYLKRFKARYTVDEIILQAKSLNKLRVLVVGEAIVDEYCYATPLGQTGKSGNIPSVKFQSTELFAGGSLAIANHLAAFASQVSLLTGVGKDETLDQFMRQRLASNVTPHFHYFDDAPTLVKRRFVDEAMNKLFEVYYYDKSPLSTALEQKIVTWILKHAADYDVVVVPDYGNGFISTAMVQALCKASRFLAVNTQINSGNRGYHAITRYPRADFISLNEPELRLAAHNRHDPLEMVAKNISQTVHAKQIAVTLGMNGAMLLDQKSGKTHHVPALSTQVVDRIGAGDAFLSLAGLSIGGGLSADVASFLGSAAAALDVQFVCNRKTVGSVELFKYITTLLK